MNNEYIDDARSVRHHVGVTNIKEKFKNAIKSENPPTIDFDRICLQVGYQLALKYKICRDKVCSENDLAKNIVSNYTVSRALVELNFNKNLLEQANGRFNAFGNPRVLNLLINTYRMFEHINSKSPWEQWFNSKRAYSDIDIMLKIPGMDKLEKVTGIDENTEQQLFDYVYGIKKIVKDL